MIPSRRWGLRGVLLPAIAFALFALSLLYTERRLEVLTSIVIETNSEGAWNLSQARFELERLQHALDNATATPPVSSAAEVRTRFDVFWSRLDVLAFGPDGERVRRLPKADTLLTELRAELARHAPAFETEPGPEAVAVLRQALPAYAVRLHDLLLTRLHLAADSHTVLQQRVFELRSASWLSLLGLLGSAGILVFLLLREVGTTRRLLSRAEQSRQQIEHVAHHDFLTGLPNRRLFEDRLAQALAAARRARRQLALHYLDLDRFKEINDTHGHRVGDELLRAVAGRLDRTLRAGDTLARLSGDEFAVIQTELKAEDDAEALAERLLTALADPFKVAQHELTTAASLGVALFPGDGADADELRANADVALYSAKSAGRGQMAFYRPELTAAGRARRELRRELMLGIDGGELELHYQPKVAAADGTVTGLEALLRWRHPRHGTLRPDTFLPLAEETGLIDRLGAWVLADACGQIGRWREQGLSPPRLAINLSRAQLRQGSLARQLGELARRSGIAPAQIELELTEHVLLDSDPRVHRELEDLGRLGVGIALDDFGTGYSSLSYLHRLRLRTLKIDRSLVSEFGDGRAEMICTHVIRLAHDLGMLVVAEGIETRRHLEIARELGFDELQGYWFAAPAPAAEIANRLRIADQGFEYAAALPMAPLSA
jgi:diguanylate cyclase (GGDEF)-like protein